MGSPREGGGGGGGTQLLNGDSQTAMQSRGSEHQNLGAVNSFEGKKGGSQHFTEKLIREVTGKICFYSLYFVIYMVLIKMYRRTAMLIMK